MNKKQIEYFSIFLYNFTIHRIGLFQMNLFFFRYTWLNGKCEV
uniref:Uncharacterized protein n=1 Tax=Anguilla anguilla TaxID=7936 RepID=A0A0E9VWY0_ANGAN